MTDRNKQSIRGELRIICKIDQTYLGSMMKQDDVVGPVKGDAATGEAKPTRLRIETSPNGETKIKVRCPQCLREGRGGDLQGSWERKILPALLAIDANPTESTGDYFL